MSKTSVSEPKLSKLEEIINSSDRAGIKDLIIKMEKELKLVEAEVAKMRYDNPGCFTKKTVDKKAKKNRNLKRRAAKSGRKTNR